MENVCSSPLVMGIININNESFYSESRCITVESFKERLDRMIADGADIIDIGACSTRPGSTPVSMEQEWSYLKEPLKSLASIKNLKISIDTFRSEIVRRAYDVIGPFIVNDISAGEDDSLMLTTVGELGLKYIAMHKRGTPDIMQQLCSYPNGIVNEVADYFIKFGERASACGIEDYIIDPGFGFAKSVEQNYELFRGMPKMMEIVSSANNSKSKTCKPALLVGISRKSMLWKLLQITPDEALVATAALNLQALMLGADILRVHDVKEAVQCVKMYSMLKQTAH